MVLISKAALVEQKEKLVRAFVAGENLDQTAVELEKINGVLGTYRVLEAQCSAIALSPPSAEWYTPAAEVERVRQVLGAIDLDPASCDRAQETVQAHRYFTKNDDGLAKAWAGRVFCNPPYGSLYVKFLQKGLDEWECGRIDEAIFLVNRSQSARYRAIKSQFFGVCEVHKRISFVSQDGTVCKSPRYYNDFLYLGPNVGTFFGVFKEIGECRVRR